MVNNSSSSGSGLRRSLLRLCGIVVLAFAAHWAISWLHTRIDATSSESAKFMLSGVILLVLLVYAVLIALPFVPGIEIGLSLLALQGSEIAPLVYAFTVLGLSISFLVGRRVPLAYLQGVAGDLGLTRLQSFLQDTDAKDPEVRLQGFRNRLPGFLRPVLTDGRYILMALALNVPGNFLIGGGGGKRWSWFFDQFTAYLRWIMVSNQAAILVGSVLLS